VRGAIRVPGRWLLLAVAGLMVVRRAIARASGRSISYLAVTYIAGAIGWRRTHGFDGILTDVIADVQTTVA
jgi:hypothetical protein